MAKVRFDISENNSNELIQVILIIAMHFYLIVIDISKDIENATLRALQ